MDQRRLTAVLAHLTQLPAAAVPSATNAFESGQTRVKWNGWGYEDTEFSLTASGEVFVTGSRYEAAGQELPHAREWVESEIGVETKIVAPSGPPPAAFTPSVENQEFLRAIDSAYARISFQGLERLHHSHGHTAQEIYQLRYGWPESNRLVDCVVWPASHEHVETIVEAAHLHNVVIIPYGGGTSVTNALNPLTGEKRMVVSLDMHLMNAIKWVDRENLTACIEAGAVGKDLSERLAQLGLTLGHEPDSAEFSTLGGWISTRASGMKKNRYGNIEDLLVNCKLVTPTGTLFRDLRVTRISAGPNLNHIILGHEGTLGVVTEAVMKLRPLPEQRIFGAIVFHSLEDGIRFMREVAYNRCQPASLRLVDNEQFRFGRALKPGSSRIEKFVELLKRGYLTQYHGVDLEQLAACTMVFEGSKSEVAAQQKKIYSIAKSHGGIKADAASGERGYALTFMVAYLRDFGFQLGFMSESFETSVPWSQCALLCTRVKETVRAKAKDLGVSGEPFASCRVTQVYDEGACVYFYIAILFQGLEDPIKTFSALEHAARVEIMACGGSLSHHHGIGKHRKEFMQETVGAMGLQTMSQIKNTIDPKNIFANGNLFDVSSK
eukprot:TRINITY_DN9174_c0_g1_i1.p1 TRINITY_DN9174_c0_g1~~TRINITY_DN9174_c0_g1_i1.p1  ORF type:complete len:607 (+),score=111.93 TRINITY_DN9174_c0_g1_i1:401-2221(+)